MKNKEFLTEAKRKAIIADKEKAIIESFAKTFNKIKRIDENEIKENDYEDWELEDRKQQYGINPEIDPADLEYGELSEEGVDEQAIIPNEIFQMEQFEREDYDLVELNMGQDDSKLEMDFGYVETEQGCYYLKATVEFYFDISGSYRAATLYEPEEGPEEEFGDGDVVEMKYVECSGDQEYQLTDEMKQIARPHVLKAFDDLREYISEKAWERLEDGRDDGPDGDDYDDRDDAREWGGVDGW